MPCIGIALPRARRAPWWWRRLPPGAIGACVAHMAANVASPHLDTAVQVVLDGSLLRDAVSTYPPPCGDGVPIRPTRTQPTWPRTSVPVGGARPPSAMPSRSGQPSAQMPSPTWPTTCGRRGPSTTSAPTGSPRLSWEPVSRGSRVAVLLPDGAGVHVAFVAAERAGLTVVGLGHRAGDGRSATSSARPERRPSSPSSRIGGAAAADLVAGLVADGLPLHHHVVTSIDGAGPLTVNGQPAKDDAVRRRGVRAG